MTLCIVWRSGGRVHFASDSRISFGTDSAADVGIKVLSIPYAIYGPINNAYKPAPEIASGGLGICIAGSTLNAFFVKESVAEVMKRMQAIPGHADIGMDGLSDFVFKAYKTISAELSKTALVGGGRTTFIIAGYCSSKNCQRVFRFDTNDSKESSKTEILLDDRGYIFIGTGSNRAKKCATPSTDMDYINILKEVINDETIKDVGGAVQYGRLEGTNFIVYGVAQMDKHSEHGLTYMRGGIDLRAPEFDSLLPGIPYLDFLNK